MLIMGMQRKIYDASFNRFYNNTAVDYSFQLEAYWQRLRRRMSVKAGSIATRTVVDIDCLVKDGAASDTTEPQLSLDVALKN